jgi:hypothetical protein
MKIGIYSGNHAAHIVRSAALFKSGLDRHAVPAVMFNDESNPPICDLYVMWAWRWPALLDRVRRKLSRAVIMELGFVGDRKNWIALGYDGLNGRAKFYTDNVPGDRLERYFPQLLRPWRQNPGGYALIMGQAPGDASLDGMNVQIWANDVVDQLRPLGVEARFRPHPVRLPEGQVMCKYAIGTLEEGLAGAAFVVTFNSNSGVDAVCAGVPTIAYDKGAMAWEMTSHCVDAPLVTPDRQRWAERLAYCQWKPDEIADGTAWDHVKQGLDDPI